jgi:hypothetical protein
LAAPRILGFFYTRGVPKQDRRLSRLVIGSSLSLRDSFEGAGAVRWFHFGNDAAGDQANVACIQ